MDISFHRQDFIFRYNTTTHCLEKINATTSSTVSTTTTTTTTTTPNPRTGTAIIF